MGAIVYRHFSLAQVLFGFPTSERKEATRRASGLFFAAAIFASPAHHKPLGMLVDPVRDVRLRINDALFERHSRRELKMLIFAMIG
jgi:hypothetical protein